jgi:hypothetical protein
MAKENKKELNIKSIKETNKKKLCLGRHQSHSMEVGTDFLYPYTILVQLYF